MDLNIDKRNCYKYDPFGLCTVVDCLKCENCTFEIHSEDYSVEESKENEIYILEFFEGIPNEEEMISYLLSEESDYRIIRYSDNEIMRYSKEDKEKIKTLGTKSKNNK